MNGRPLSPFIRSFFESRAASNSRAYNTHLAITIRLRTGAEVYVATNDLVINSLSIAGVSTALGSPVSYLGKIQSPPDIQFTQTSSSDGGTGFSVSNLDYLLSAFIPDASRLFDGASVKVYIAFPKSDGNYEGLLYAIGVLKTVEGDHELATISYVSDVSDKDNTAGGRELTQRCLNELGVNTGRSWCSATGVTIGVSTCTKVLDDKIGGCGFWGQQHAFQGIPFFNPNGLVANYSGELPPAWGGQGGLGGGCFDVDSWYRTVEGHKQGHKLKRGDKLLNHLEEIALIESISIEWCEYRYEIWTPAGTRAIVSATHKALTNMQDRKGAAITSLLRLDDHVESKVLKYQKEMHIADADEMQARIVEYVRGRGYVSPFTARVAPAGKIVKLGLTDPHTYLAGIDKGKMFAAHNQKPIYDDYSGYNGGTMV